MDASGGDGIDGGGGGSGGRIAVFTDTTNLFYGVYNAWGGTATDELSAPRGGGSGTVYLWQPRNGLPYESLLIDNQNRPHSQFVMLDENKDYYEFDEVHLPRQSSLHINESRVTAELVIHKLIGDRTGLLQSHAGHVLFVEVVESVPTVSKTPVNFVIDRGSEMVFGPTLHVIGLGVPTFPDKSPISLDLNGRLTNVDNIIVNQFATVFFRESAHTAKLENGEYVKIGSAGNFSFGTIQLLTESNMNFSADLGMRFLVNEFQARYASRLSAEHIELLTSSISVEVGSLVTCSAGDRPEDTVSSSQGQGSPGSSTYEAGGAGHANLGGNSYDVTDAVGADGGTYYGDLFMASERGSNGGDGFGSTPGGRGGGYMNIVVGSTFRLDGQLSVDASDGASGSGGGSGGSVYISAKEFDGLGAITAHGGGGDGITSGGGSGGIITVHTSQANNYEGTYDAYGGQGNPNNGEQVSHGGPGSVFLHHLVEGYPYTKLFIDNRDRSWVHYFTLREAGKSDFYLDEIHIDNNASLQLIDDGLQQKLTVSKLFGDRTGLVHIHGSHTHTYDVIEGEVTTMKLPVNLRIDPGGVAELATTVDVIGAADPAFHWDGQLLGVRHLRISPNVIVHVYDQAHTALIQNNEYVFLDDPGTFRFSSLDIAAQASVVFIPPLGATFVIGDLVSTILPPSLNTIYPGNMYEYYKSHSMIFKESQNTLGSVETLG